VDKERPQIVGVVVLPLISILWHLDFKIEYAGHRAAGMSATNRMTQVHGVGMGAAPGFELGGPAKPASSSVVASARDDNEAHRWRSSATRWA
jgi:hypothetical protein